MAGGTPALSTALENWQQRLTTRGLAMLGAASKLGDYLAVLDITGPPQVPHAATAEA